MCASRELALPYSETVSLSCSGSFSFQLLYDQHLAFLLWGPPWRDDVFRASREAVSRSSPTLGM